MGKIEEMNASTWPPGWAPGGGLARARRQSIRLSRLAWAWRWLGLAIGAAPAGGASFGRSPNAEATSWLAPGDIGCSTAAVPVMPTAETAAVRAGAATSDPVEPVASPGLERKAASVSGRWPTARGSSIGLAEARRSWVGSTPRCASATVDRSGCVTPMIEPRRAHPTMTGAPTSTDTRREPKVGRRIKLVSSSLTMECGAVACPRLNRWRAPVLAKMRPPALFGET